MGKTLGLPQFTCLYNYLLIAGIYNRYTKICAFRHTYKCNGGTWKYFIHTEQYVDCGCLTSNLIHKCLHFTLLQGLIKNTAFYFTPFALPRLRTFHAQDLNI